MFNNLEILLQKTTSKSVRKKKKFHSEDTEAFKLPRQVVDAPQNGLSWKTC